ncbi:4-amino-4-deoxychorismate lyase [Brevibacterium iodinum ATCC 49514]|uniref:4-amino-4-deoxychorismate lyase n=1 Tax=Brevibacterium iodinum ATCC 49514 TaxID=1255616 RepID=A0A2H1JR93_9MICO|nr:aminotransferase class IV [Brevibacterium iodinum]SMX89854.1 4-amino-4-deoxychorismate lyase [Brevibacterium iodinum ATCC 49514]SUW13902.1 Branched-chain-amino-acid aminotransferase [Brevibacterium iodinum]
MTDPLILVNPATGTFELTDLRSAQLPVTDLSAHRGDGIFETVLVSVGAHGATVVSRERHFTRFRASASALDLPDPDQGLWDRVIDSLIAEVAAADPENVEFGIRYALSRGEQDANGAFRGRGWAFPVPVDDHIRTAREQGVTAVSLDRGFDAYIGSKAPWLLIGAKTLSYAVNQAAGRYAAANDADEALFVSHDGIVLEGPTANLIIRRGDHLLTPNPEAGLLSGTTQRLIFDHAEDLGLRAEYADLSLDDVKAADGAWYVSSMRTAVALRELDGNAISIDQTLTDRFQEIIRGR